MGSIYPRKNKLWIAYFDANGKRQLQSTGLALEQRAEAERLLEAIERRVDAERHLGVRLNGDTVGAYRKHWIAGRERNGFSSWKDERNWLGHAAELEGLCLVDVRPRYARDLVYRLRREGKLSPRSVLHVYRTLRQMFRDAVIDGLVSSNPIDVRKSDLPKKRDKNLRWRATAVFTREEVEQLVSSEKVPADRRVLYALLFLTGCRIGEIADRRWGDLEHREPLDALHVHSSYSTKGKRSKTVKTEVARLVPVHPTLAKVLAEWRLGGWASMIGAKPESGDLLIPTAAGGPRTSNHVRNKLLADLGRLGLRARRTHDTRRTFISLARADGARLDILRLITHGPSGDVLDAYTTIPWASLCDEVRRLKVRQLGAATPLLHPARAGKKGQ